MKLRGVHEEVIFYKIYHALVERLGEDNAKEWALSTIITFRDGVYDDKDELIQTTIEEAQK